MKEICRARAFFLILLAMLLLVFLSSCNTRGEKGESGEKGASGANGKSAYELAVENGYSGTLDEWLASLVGAAGAPGTPGAAGVTPKLQINAETNLWEVSYDNGATWESLNVSATGDAGDPGAPGTPGAAGATPKLQINAETNLWEVSYDNGATWESLNVPATGDAGAPGASGKPGSSIVDAYINSSYHLILVLSDGEKIDAGYVGVSGTPEPVPIYTVTFTDYDGTVLAVQTVESGEDATPPENPARDGYVFAGWDGEYTNVTADCIVTATYTVLIPQFAITFIDHNGMILLKQDVNRGEDATPPENPVREGYIFAGWYGTYTDVMADCTVVATYTAQPEAPAIVVSEHVVQRGASEVAVTISICQNPGLASAKLVLEFDNAALILDRVVYNTAIGGQALLPQNNQSPLTLNWFNGTQDATGDFVFVTLYFSVSDTAEAGNYEVTATYNADDIYNIEETNIDFAVMNGKITVTE